ncbi:MAG: hypothetical protein QM783_14770 [Phycisphaerales bacterium]
MILPSPLQARATEPVLELGSNGASRACIAHVLGLMPGVHFFARLPWKVYAYPTMSNPSSETPSAALSKFGVSWPRPCMPPAAVQRNAWVPVADVAMPTTTVPSALTALGCEWRSVGE